MKGTFKIKGIVGSGMVLQRNKINCIYGTAEVYSDVIMEFRGTTSITQSDEDGNWKIEFSPGEAGGPFEMSIKCDEHRVEFNDIYVGEVWVSSGQSNAQLPMERMKFSYPEEFMQPRNERIRMLTVPINWSLDGEKWTKCEKTFQAREGKWIGATVGIYAVSGQECRDRGWIDVDWFRVLRRD